MSPDRIDADTSMPPRTATPAGTTDPMTAGQARREDEPTSREEAPTGSASGEPQPAQRQDGAPKETVVLVRGETVDGQQAKTSGDGKQQADKPAAAPKQVSPEKQKLREKLPALKDDADVGVQMEHTVTRDGKADILFDGVLLASAAPEVAPKGEWQEYRVYETNGGKYVFSKVHCSIYLEKQDESEAEVFDPSPQSMPSKLLRSVRDVAMAGPMTWKDAAADYFGYDPLAKVLYRKLGHQFEEHVE